MAEVLLSPGVLATETDSSFLTAQPIQAGAAILGPTAKGPVGIPTLVTTYSDYKNRFGAKVESGSAEYTYFTSIAAYNYFQQGGDSLLVTRIVSGSYGPADSGTSGVGTISSSDNTTCLVLETHTEGTIMNSISTLGTSGELPSGSADNVRWEIVSPNTSSGTFGLLIRQGDDTTSKKTVLETWTGLSLDPNATNYVSRIIGDQRQQVKEDGGEYYLQLTGSFPNQSRYVRVRSVVPTLNYFDNAGNAKSEFTESLPIAKSGAFEDGEGAPFVSTGAANFYGSINSTNTQGLIATNYNNSISLLANQDEFRYNLIIAPGLYQVDYSSQITSLVNNAQTRGDNIAIVDMVKYAQTLGAAGVEATSMDSSYAATYWPWLQTKDPDLGRQVWVPASTMMAGVYAFNDKSTEAWFAPAGLNRGGLSTVLRAERKLTNGNRDTLYQANVNPIATFPNAGVVVFGQKTLQKKASALDRVNVRRLLIALKSYISQIADNLVFEQNTIATRNNFLSQVNPYLESVQQRQGLFAFKVVMDESNNTPDVIDRNQLVGQFYLQPTKTAEFIYLDFNILPTGATFPA
jgi:phage tail sheath protein FI